MKAKNILWIIFLVSTILTANAQNRQDAIEITNDEKVPESSTNTPLRNKTSMGYHHNNYKHPAKAEQVKAFYKEKGHVNRKSFLTKYKMPYTDVSSTSSEKEVISSSKSPKRSRNYKQPYSTN